MIVTGPIVIAPLLRTARLSKRPAALLQWEAIVSDPIGALAAVLAFSVVSEWHTSFTAEEAMMQLAVGIGFATVVGWAARVHTCAICTVSWADRGGHAGCLDHRRFCVDHRLCQGAEKGRCAGADDRPQLRQFACRPRCRNRDVFQRYPVRGGRASFGTGQLRHHRRRHVE